MKRNRLFTLALAILTIASFILTGCEKKEVALTLDAPFTKMDWDSTLEDVIAAEGEDYETYDSVYNGTTYTFNKKFEDKDGIIKYMFDDKEKLMCVAWTYGSTEIKELENLYNKINDDVTDKHGDSGYTADTNTGINNYGNIWYLETGDIVISTMMTEENKALQYAYLHPDVSYSKED